MSIIPMPQELEALQRESLASNDEPVDTVLWDSREHPVQLTPKVFLRGLATMLALTAVSLVVLAAFVLAVAAFVKAVT